MGKKIQSLNGTYLALTVCFFGVQVLHDVKSFFNHLSYHMRLGDGFSSYCNLARAAVFVSLLL